MKDRRKHPRQIVDISGEIFVGGILYPYRIKNISEGGFFVETDVFISVEERCV